MSHDPALNCCSTHTLSRPLYPLFLPYTTLFFFPPPLYTVDATATSSFFASTIHGALSRVPPLDNTIYWQWSFAMKSLFDGKDIWEQVNPIVPEIEAPVPGTAAATQSRAQVTR